MAYENLKSVGIKYLLTKLKTVFLQIKDAVKTVNGNEPDENGDITVTSVPYAQNLESESTHRNEETFIQRTSAGSGSVYSGDAWLMDIKGNNVHTGFVAKSITHTETPERDNQITITINEDTFIAKVGESGTYEFLYTSSWSVDLSEYGIAIATGTPTSGDKITVIYIEEEPGTITVANPQSLVSTGWNLFNNTAGYARVVRYANGFRISGTYSSVKYSLTEFGERFNVTVTNGAFNPFTNLASTVKTAFVWVSGDDTSDVAIWATWEDWTEEYVGDFESYTQSVIDFSSVMSSKFPYGLMKAGSIVDEINFNLGRAYSRVERLSNTTENMASAKSSGRDYEYDSDYIYLARVTEISTEISVSGGYEVNDHGIEYFTGTEVAVPAETLYGNNLKNKLERDVVTISQQTLTNNQKEQVRSNIGALGANSISHIGAVITGTNANDLSVPTGGWNVISSAELVAGTWFICGGFEFTAFSEIAGCSLASGTTQEEGACERSIGNVTKSFSVAAIVSPDVTTTYNLRATQSSGSAKTASKVRLRAVRIA